MSAKTCDAVVIGGGIAGVSVAAELATSMDVVLVEREAQLAYHTTGRSAALYFGSYGHSSTLPLTAASRAWFDDPEFTDAPVLAPRGALTVAFDGAPVPDLLGAEQLGPDEAADLVPVLDRARLTGAAYERGAADMDVAAIHQAFVRKLRHHRGEVRTTAPVTGLERNDETWTVQSGSERITAAVVVNAAGAWADEVARLAGAEPIGIQPRRRTAFMVTAPPSSEHWPMVTDAGHTFYFKPDGVQLLCSPADETPSPPVDARPEEVDIALAIERINAVTDLGIRSVRSAWAGLRTFAPDGGMALGFDAGVDGFFWLAGQGGTGIQTAPASARLAAGLIQSGSVPDDLPSIDLAALDPARFGRR